MKHSWLLIVVLLIPTQATFFDAHQGQLNESENRKYVISSIQSLNFSGYQDGSIYIENTLTVGREHACAIMENHSVYCWGRNYFGMLGNGGTSSSNVPVAVEDFGNSRFAVSISAGGYTTCAILNTGEISCWGYAGIGGRLGNGDNQDSSVPVDVDSLGSGRTATAISVGESTSCAILDNSSIVCWGDGDQGAIGDNGTQHRSSPTLVHGIGGTNPPVAISSGGNHHCALMENGSVMCWGLGSFGRLGDGGATNKLIPTYTMPFGNDTKAVSLSISDSHGCVLLEDRNISCWGYNSVGQTGSSNYSDGSDPNSGLPPLHVSGIPHGYSPDSISVGDKSTCVRNGTGSVLCWGSGSGGRLGNNQTGDSHTPVEVLLDGKNSSGVSIGGFSACSAFSDGKIKCWGWGNHGQLGNGNWQDSLVPVDVILPTSTTKIALAERDLDGDGCLNNFDSYPNDSSECKDSDQDGIPDNSDSFPYDPNETSDSDNDGVGDNEDAFPYDANETKDSDGDGFGDNSDLYPEDPTESIDSDGDGVGDNSDQFPNDANETIDSDGDGVGDNADQFPNDANELIDSDGDGVGDNGDQFPNDANETIDSDGDGVGDNADQFPNDAVESIDSDGDGVGDTSDALPFNPNETMDSDGDGTGDNSDLFPNDSTEQLDSDSDGIGDNSDLCPDSEVDVQVDSDGCEVSDTNSNENQTNSNTTVLDLTCLQDDFDCDFILDSEDTDADGDGIIDELFDDDNTSTSADNLHKMIVKRTPTGFEIEIRFEMLTYPSFASQVSWVSMYYENGTEREAPLIWDFSLSDGTFKMGVPSDNMTQLEQTMCQHPMGSPIYSTFDMFEWLENSINLNGISIAPGSIDCSWKNKPSYVDLNVITAQIESPDFLMNMHEEHELLVYKIKIETRDDAQNLTMAPIWAVNQSAMLSANFKAFNVENKVDDVDEIWYWWSQNYSAPLDLSGASVEDENGASNGGGSGSVGIAIVLFLGVLLIQRRKRKKIKKQMKKIAKQQIKEEKEAKKLAKLEKKNKSNQQADSTDESIPETMEELASQTPPPKPPMAPPKPSQDASGVIGDDGYEWITFPPNSQSHFYRVPGEREWSPWDG